MNLTIAEQIIYSVIQINMLDSQGVQIGTASGFIGSFSEDKEKEMYIPAIVTNRHVLSNCANISVIFTRAKESGDPDVGNTVSVQMSTSRALTVWRSLISVKKRRK